MGAPAPMPLLARRQRRRCAVAQGRGIPQMSLLKTIALVGLPRETPSDSSLSTCVQLVRAAAMAGPKFAAFGGLTELTTRLSARREAPPTNKLNKSGDDRVWPAKS